MSRAHLLTYISFGYDMLTAAGKVRHRTFGKLRSTCFPVSPRTSLQQYSSPPHSHQRVLVMNDACLILAHDA
jgi:hypothetical protein